MKKIFAVALLAVMATAGNLFAGAATVFDTDIVNDPAIMADANYSVDLKSAGVDWLSVQGLWSQNSYPALTFTDGVYATGSITISTTTGVAGSTITVNGFGYVEGKHWIVKTGVGGSSTTATSLYNVMVATYTPYYVVGGSSQTVPIINSYIASSLVTGQNVIRSTAVATGPGGNFVFASSTPTAVVVVSMTGGALTDITNSYITKFSSYPTALPLLLTVTAGALPTGLTANTTYFALQYPPYYLKLSTTVALANAGYGLTISALTPGTNESFTLTPVAMQAGSNYSYKWQASNDNSTWYDMVATSVTITSAASSGNAFWDFGFTTYNYIRAALSAGSFGAINLKLRGYGKR
jgi:hypothetical protein